MRNLRCSTREHFLDAREEYGSADDSVLDFAIRGGRPVDSSQVAAKRVWESCGAYAALTLDGYRHSLEASVMVGGNVFGTVKFARARGPEVSEQDLVATRFACDQLGLAVERAVRYGLTDHRTSMLEGALDCIPQPVVATDMDGRLLFSNRAARNAPTGTLNDPVNESIGEAIYAFRTLGKRV